MNYTVLCDSPAFFLVATQTPVSAYSEREADRLGIDTGKEDAYEPRDVVIDLTAMAPLKYIRPSLDGATCFIDCDNEAYVVYVPYEKFVGLYLRFINSVVDARAGDEE